MLINCTYLFSANLVAASTPDCRVGDLNGKKEEYVGTFTNQECWDAALAVGANGAITIKDCPSRCSCFAEFSADAWNSGTYLGCIFYSGEQIEQSHHVEYLYYHVFKNSSLKLFLYS